MLKLIKLLRDGVIQDWDEYFKPTLLILLETLGDDGVSVLFFHTVIVFPAQASISMFTARFS